jgi:hypothetical protein
MTTSTGNRTLIQQAALLVGAVFVLVGLLGFVPGITTSFDELSFASNDSGAELLGIFQVSVLHNIVHLLFGVVGIAMAKSVAGAKTFLVGGGAIYVVLFLYGMVIDKESAANFVPLNTADDYLHLVLGIAMIGLGSVLGKKDARV